MILLFLDENKNPIHIFICLKCIEKNGSIECFTPHFLITNLNSKNRFSIELDFEQTDETKTFV